MRIEISKIDNGWDISAIDDTGSVLKTAWADTGSSAYSKAEILASFYRTDNGQTAPIVWKNVYDHAGAIVSAE